MNTMTDGLNDRVAEALSAIADEATVPAVTSGDVITMSNRQGRRRRTAFGAAAAAVVAVAGFGVSQLITDRTDVGPAADASELELVPGLLIPVSSRETQAGSMRVVEAAVGPAPLLDPSTLGEEFPLRPLSPESFVVPTDELGAGDGPALGSDVLVSLGEIDNAQIGLHRFNDSVCVYLGNLTTVTGGGACGQSGEVSITLDGTNIDPAIGSWVAAVGIPAPTSIVVAEFTNNLTLWQRPVGRTAFFLKPDGIGLRSLTFLDPSGEELPDSTGEQPGSPVTADLPGSTATSVPAQPVAASPPQRVDSESFDLVVDWEALHIEVSWTDPAPQRSQCGSILVFDPTTRRWEHRWQFHTDKANQQRTWPSAQPTECEDETFAGPGPDTVSPLEEMRGEPELLLCWFPYAHHGCETVLPHELVLGDAALVWKQGALFLQLTGIEVLGYQVNPIQEIAEEDRFDPPIDLLVLYLNERPEGKANPSASPDVLWGIGLRESPPGTELTFRLDLEDPDGHPMASTGEFTLQIPNP
ncbi:MAG: hypothetical protein GY701_25650 [Sulfitobacter sp.]|nr:hypothetical protein [Sulfitobacter sp.]